METRNSPELPSFIKGKSANKWIANDRRATALYGFGSTFLQLLEFFQVAREVVVKET